MAAGKREDALDAGLLEGASGQLSAVHGHADTSMRYQRRNGISRSAEWSNRGENGPGYRPALNSDRRL
jgi:hypothetical protein